MTPDRTFQALASKPPSNLLITGGISKSLCKITHMHTGARCAVPEERVLKTKAL